MAGAGGRDRAVLPEGGWPRTADKGLLLREGTIVDATLIAVPPSTKNRDKQRDPEMHQAKKGNEWHFGVKAHIGVDADSGLVHTVVATAANVGDVTQAHALLHGDERVAFGDAGYQGVDKREENCATPVTWHVAMKRGKRQALPANRLGRLIEQIEKAKASLRAKVEHCRPASCTRNDLLPPRPQFHIMCNSVFINTAQSCTGGAPSDAVLADDRPGLAELACRGPVHEPVPVP